MINLFTFSNKAVNVIIFTFVLMLSFLYPRQVLAEWDHTCWNSPVPILQATLSASTFPSYKKGASAVFTTTAPPYTMMCNFNSSPKAEEVEYSTFWLKATLSANLIPSDLNPGFYKINDDVDVKIGVIDNTAQSVIAPFTDYPQLNGGKIVRTQGTPIVEPFTYSSAENSQLTFKLRRDLPGGVLQIPSMDLASVYRRFGDTEYYSPGQPNAGWASNPVITTHLNASSIPIPINCSINNGQQINVDFGAIQAASITSSSGSVSQTKNISISCTTAPTEGYVALSLQGTPATFSDSSGNSPISTTDPNLGVLVSSSNTVLSPEGNNNISVNLDNGVTGTTSLTFSVIKKAESELAGGAFSASAVLIISNP